MLDSILFGYADKRYALQPLDGAQYEGAVTLDEVRTQLFSWEARETPVMYDAGADIPDLMVAEKQKVIYRSDTLAALGVVGDGFVVHQYNQWLADNVETLLDDEVTIQSAGTLNGGAQAWVQIASPENVTGPGGFEYRPFILAGTALNGSLSTFYKRNVIDIVCENTARASFKRSKSMDVRIKHTRNSAFRLGEVRESLQILFDTRDEFAAELEELLAIEVTDTAFERIVQQLVAPSTDSDRSKSIASRKTGEFLDLWRHDDRVTPWKNTGLGAMQALSTHRQWVGTVKGGTHVERNAANLVNGISDREDLRAFELITAVA